VAFFVGGKTLLPARKSALRRSVAVEVETAEGAGTRNIPEVQIAVYVSFYNAALHQSTPD
jgi:hypothetical protein